MNIEKIMKWLKEEGYNYEISIMDFGKIEYYKNNYLNKNTLLPFPVLAVDCQIINKYRDQETLADLHRKRGYA